MGLSLDLPNLKYNYMMTVFLIYPFTCAGTQPYLLFVDQGYGAIYQSRLNGSGINTLVRGLSAPVSLDFDYRYCNI